MTSPLFYTDPGALDGVGPGDRVRVTGPEARHAVQSMRLGPGEAVDLGDGRGRHAVGVVHSTGMDLLEVTVEHVRSEPSTLPRLVLLQALAKGDRDLLAVQTATELGVDAVIPWQAERSIVRWKGERAAKAHAKWVSTVQSAAQQARRALVPEVRDLVQGPEAARLAVPGTVVVVLHEDATQPWGDIVREHLLAATQVQEVILAVGPEGGISPAEVAALTEAGAHLAVLGPHVLRASTAGPAALAVLQELLGRW